LVERREVTGQQRDDAAIVALELGDRVHGVEGGVSVDILREAVEHEAVKQSQSSGKCLRDVEEGTAVEIPKNCDKAGLRESGTGADLEIRGQSFRKRPMVRPSDSHEGSAVSRGLRGLSSGFLEEPPCDGERRTINKAGGRGIHKSVLAFQGRRAPMEPELRATVVKAFKERYRVGAPGGLGGRRVTKE
jgi:hypothetical protein